MVPAFSHTTHHQLNFSLFIAVILIFSPGILKPGALAFIAKRPGF
jgi:hypothetical protein